MLSWLKQKPMYYWGDIDTHGFAILDQLRSKFLHVQSLYQALLQHKFQQNLRLEQERIYFDFLVEKLDVI